MNIYDPISTHLNLVPISDIDTYRYIYVDYKPDDASISGFTNNGRVFDEEWRNNISKSNKGRPGPNKGKKLPDNHPFKNGTNNGRIWTEEQKDRVRAKLKGRKLSED
jgi:hypothetical protein